MDNFRNSKGGKMNKLMTVRQQFRLSQWSAMVQEREESGLSVKHFCEERGINPKTYYYRLKKLRETMINTSAPEIVQVDIPFENTQSNPEIVIRVDNTTIEVSGKANRETVRAAVSFLKQL